MDKRSFREMTQGMSFVEKAEYLWGYYRWTLLVAFFGVIVISMVVTGIVNSQAEPDFAGIVVNMPLSEEGTAFLTDDWGKIIGAEKEGAVQLFSTSFQDLDSTSDLEMAAATAYQVVLMIAGEDYDYILMDEAALNYYENHSIFTPLDAMFPEEVLEEYGDWIILHTTDQGEEYPLALDITESAFVSKYVGKDTKVYIGFPGNTGRTQMDLEFFEYIMNVQ